MEGRCISVMVNSSLRSPTLPREVVALRGSHQPAVEDPLAIQGNETWHEEDHTEEGQRCPTRPLRD